MGGGRGAADAGGLRSGALPPRLSRFFGREPEVAELRALLGTERLVTLVGAPGCGKTRLALEVAAQVAAGLPGGVRFVELAPVGDPASVVAAVGRALGVPEEPGRPLDEVLVDALREAEPVLVVLDNCEHVVDAAAAVARHLVTACPPVRVMATSRSALGVPGERAWSVPRLDPAAAVQLFVDRARTRGAGPELHEGDDAVVEEICTRLDCLPLAVELTAAWSRVLSPGQILDRVNGGAREITARRRDRGSRHDTMAAAVDWSYRLLRDDEQRLFRQVSVFAGSFDLEALDAVAELEGPDGNDGDTLGPLTELVDDSLVAAEREPGGPMRYRMLEPVRQHASALLAGSGEADEVRRRHVEHYLRLARRYDPWRQDGDTKPVRVEQVARDEGNLVAALEWALRHPSDLGLRLAAAAGQYFAYGGRVNDGLRWLREALAQGTHDLRLRAEALAEAGQLAWRQGDYEGAQSLLEEALAVAGSLDDLSLSAWTLRLLSAVEFSAGQCEAAAKHAQEAVDAYAACGDQLGVASALVSRAWTRYAGGDASSGDDDMRAALEANQRFGNATVAAYGHFGSSYGASLRGDAGAQRSHLAAALAGIEDGGVVERSDWLGSAAMLAGIEGRFRSAVRVLGGMDAWERRRGGAKTPAQLTVPFAPLSRRIFEQVGETLATRLWAQGKRMRWDELVAEALEQRPERSPLTRREDEVATLVAQGLTNVEIARRLVLSRRTVESHVDHIKQKLALGSRNEIIVWVLQESQLPRGS